MCVSRAGQHARSRPLLCPTGRAGGAADGADGPVPARGSGARLPPGPHPARADARLLRARDGRGDGAEGALLPRRTTHPQQVRVLVYLAHLSSNR